MASLSQAKLRQREMNDPLSIRFEPVPLDEEIKGGQRKGQPGLECRPGPMRDFFQMTDTTQHREHALHQHPGIPQTPITQFEIGRIALFGMECRITITPTGCRISW